MKSMKGLLSMIGIQTEMEYQMCDFPFGFKESPLAIPKGSIPSDKQQCQPKSQHEFTIKGVKIMAASKKDAIKKYNHRKKNKAYESKRISSIITNQSRYGCLHKRRYSY